VSRTAKFGLKRHRFRKVRGMVEILSIYTVISPVRAIFSCLSENWNFLPYLFFKPAISCGGRQCQPVGGLRISGLWISIPCAGEIIRLDCSTDAF